MKKNYIICNTHVYNKQIKSTFAYLYAWTTASKAYLNVYANAIANVECVMKNHYANKVKPFYMAIPNA